VSFEPMLLQTDEASFMPALLSYRSDADF